jgi:Transposase IS66 family
LDGWVMRVGELLRPISGAMAQELLAGNYIQADETPVGVQPESVRGKNHQAYLWQYSRPSGVVVFDFRMGREREGPRRFLGNFEGVLQSDGYAASEQETLTISGQSDTRKGRQNRVKNGPGSAQKKQSHARPTRAALRCSSGG